MSEHDSTTVGWQPVQRSRFEVAAPRHFLLPAILLLLAEKPRHGYSLAKGLQELQMGRVDRPSVYRSLAQLEHDGLVDPASTEGGSVQGRREYCLTLRGEQVLRRWMGVIKQERDGLDRVLRRYVATGTVDAVLAEVEGRWHAVTATPWSPVSPTSRLGWAPDSAAPLREVLRNRSAAGGQPAGDGIAREGPDATRFRVVPERSVVLIEARSSVGPITFGAIGVTGVIEASVDGRRVCPRTPPKAQLQIEVERIQSGNRLYDAELMRRIDARRHPTVGLELQACTSLGSTGRYRLCGDVTFHGVSKPLDGTVAVDMPSEQAMIVRGEQVVDIRDFGVASPTALMLRIYPDVIVKLQIEANVDGVLEESG